VATFFGNNVSGGTSQTTVASTVRGSKFTCADNATATAITIWANGNGASANIRTAIYSDTAGVPDAKLATSTAAVNISTTAAWQAFSITLSLVAGTAYWLMCFGDAGWVFYYAAGSANQAVSHTGETYPTWPANTPANNAFSARAMAFYVDYTVSSSGPIGGKLIQPGPSVQLYTGR
jgi:hypothetical protein